MTKPVSALAAAAVALVLALVVALVVLTGAGADVAPASATAAAADDSDEQEPPADQKAKGPRAKSRDGHGPPPWAHGAGGRDHQKWHAEWKAMTPRERERTMKGLADEHAAGMRAWAKCKADDGDDCQKPTPPGLAKKQ